MRTTTRPLARHTRDQLLRHRHLCTNTHCAQWQASVRLANFGSPEDALESVELMATCHWNRPLWEETAALLEMLLPATD